MGLDVEIRLEPGRAAPKVLILTGEMNETVAELARRLSAGESRFLAGRRGEEVLLLDPAQEERLAGGPFLRVSHGELVNFDHVRSLDLSMAGTISLRLDNGDAAFVSRRNMGRIKSYLGI